MINVRKVKEVCLNTAIVTVIVLSIAIMVLCTGCQAIGGLGQDITNTAHSTAKAIQSYGAKCTAEFNKK